MFRNRNEAKAEVRQLPSGFWAVFIGGGFVDAASPSAEGFQQALRTGGDMIGVNRRGVIVVCDSNQYVSFLLLHCRSFSIEVL